MIEMLHRQSELPRDPQQAFLGEVPEMLRWRHQSPLRARPASHDRCEVTGRDHDNTARFEVAVAKREHFPRLRKMLDDIKHRDDVNLTNLFHICPISRPGNENDRTTIANEQ